MYWGETEIKLACLRAGMTLEQAEEVVRRLPRRETRQADRADVASCSPRGPILVKEAKHG